MATDTKLNNLVINYLSQSQYNAITKNEDELYLTPDKETYYHTIVIKENNRIIFAANRDVDSATPVSTLETLISTFKNTTTAGFGDYILLIIGTRARLMAQDGTSIDLSTLTVTISDTVK